MGWSIGYDSNWDRDIGYGVPATCDHPGCGKEIDRGLAYLCGGPRPNYGAPHGCGLFFCSDHKQIVRVDPADEDGEWADLCERCQAEEQDPFQPTPDVPRWIRHKLTDESWQRWRDEYPKEVAKLRASVPVSGEQ
jgi:hypothetical protein